MQERHRDKIFLEDRHSEANQWEAETRKKVTDVNVNEDKFLPKPAEPGLGQGLD
jgi:hypothetical protein